VDRKSVDYADAGGCLGCSDLPADREAVVQYEVGEDIGPIGERPRFDGEAVAEEGEVDGGFGAGAGPVNDGVEVIPPSPGGIGKPMTGIPYVGMLAGADLVVDIEGVEVSLGTQIEHPQVPSGDQPNQVVGGVVARNHTPGRPVPLAKRTDTRGPRVPRAERARGRIEPVAGLRKPLPRPRRGFRRINSPGLGANGYAATAKAGRPHVWQRCEITRG
jgi:hypothetical protein